MKHVKHTEYTFGIELPPPKVAIILAVVFSLYFGLCALAIWLLA